MPRPHKHLHPWREPPVPQPAATILLLRDAATGPEVLMTRRSKSASFAPGVFVFPGGTLDPADSAPETLRVVAARPGQDLDTQAFSVAALREAFEELGILLAYDSSGRMITQQEVDQFERNPDAGITSQLAAAGYRLAIDQVWHLRRWITDRDLPRRFDTHFFVARMPEGQRALADETEQFEPVWISAREALERHSRRDFAMIFPTVRTLRGLADYRTVNDILAALTDGPTWPASCPRAGTLKGAEARYAEGDPPFGELELVSPDGGGSHALDWQHERPVPLLQHVWRLTAPNPGMMTGPGTNTYIVGDHNDGFAVIDPGPDDPGHVARIAALVGDRLRYIVCTHDHPDHWPGAPRLQATSGGVIHGLPGAGQHFDRNFFPENRLGDGDCLRIGDSTLRALHTPGHASGHICLMLEEDHLLFSGDHIINGSTVVIDPPDGNMNDYLASLQRLLELPTRFILPAHGWVMGEPAQAIRALIKHRLGREAKVIRALAETGPCEITQLVTRAYSDVPVALHQIAQRSLLAHLEKLSEDGRVALRDNRWRLLVK